MVRYRNIHEESRHRNYNFQHIDIISSLNTNQNIAFGNCGRQESFKKDDRL